MLVRLIAAAALVVALASARKFNNPVIETDAPDPGIIKFEDTYYVVTTTNNNNPEKFPIHKSTDLQNWELIGYMFNASNLPVYSDKDHEYWAPEIHKIGDGFVSYFVARDLRPNQENRTELYIGVATAPHPAGPWKSADNPLWRDPVGGAIDANLMNDNGNLYLLWKGHLDYIEARRLNKDGLSFVDPTEESVKLFRNDLPWEGGVVEGPWYMRRGDYHYIMYAGSGTCDDTYAVGVARSRFPLGPYEKHGDPILVQWGKFKGPGHNSAVVDVDGVSEVILYHVHFDRCDIVRPMAVSSMGWGDDDWPYIYDYED